MAVNKIIQCPRCSADITVYSNPVPTVDIIIETQGGFVLIERKNEPYGWAIPGGFVDYGESVADAAIREAREETSLDVNLQAALGVYSNPSRDPRQHTISTVFIASARGMPAAGDDAKNAAVYTNLKEIPHTVVFDHRKILEDYEAWKHMRTKGGTWTGLFFT